MNKISFIIIRIIRAWISFLACSLFFHNFRKIEFPPPNEEARLDILKIHSRKMNLTRCIQTIFFLAPVAIPALSRFGSRHLSKILI
jgi:hypothetical protein